MYDAIEGIKKEIGSLNSISLKEIGENKKILNKTTALIVVDMVRGFYDIGPLASDRVERTISPIEKLNEDLTGCKKVFFIDSHTEESVEFNNYPPHCLENTAEEELISLIKSDDNTVLIKKNSINGFHAPKFKEWLDENSEIENFIVVGVCSNICVETFVITLKTYFNQFNMNKRIIVPMNSTETYELGNHNADLMNLMTFYKLKNNGIEVVKEIN
ncbi:MULTISPECIES: isochorismatase family cysteine hydrolase [Clostridium]|uniref:Cysteine hydrolase n=1 Tax=Clostridium cibarium TaxID=2762247 RepID=A0ABR8PR90_9CLOT|nr:MULTISPECIES: isochorismatase family cysteine hydrolase [Clostridium]MBD7910645.1 cysteine hydrolase [Clostridium cibarium]